ncbi:hypothetical protein ACHQM5_010056 [Ranunculus cassubicifolius]
MCKSKMKTDATEPPTSTPRRTRSSSTSSAAATFSSSSFSTRPPDPLAKPSDPSSSSYANYTSSFASSTISSRNSLSSLRESLPETAFIYDFSEISTATNNFLSKRFSSSSTSAWRCTVRGKDVLVFQRKFRRPIQTSELRERLSVICKSHHMSLIKLLGASISGDHIYLVYDFVNGANLADCLRNPKNLGFTVLSNWLSRMQIAIDLAQGLEYIHHYTGSNQSHVHNHIKSSSLIITEPSFNGKICHFGTAELCGEVISQNISVESSPRLKRSDSRNMKFQGTRGYMSPEFQSEGVPTQKSDVFAFGVVILELLSGEEPLKYRFESEQGDYRRVSIIETARQVMESDQPGRLRRWIDKRLKDSFPLEVAEKMTRLALDCVDIDPDTRPDMRHVAGKMSKLYLQSRVWADRIKPPTDITVSLAPR